MSVLQMKNFVQVEKRNCLWVRVSVFLQPGRQIPGGVGGGGPAGARYPLHPDWGLRGPVERGITGERRSNIIPKMRIPCLEVIFPTLKLSLLSPTADVQSKIRINGIIFI